MVEISMSGSGEGGGWETGRRYSHGPKRRQLWTHFKPAHLSARCAAGFWGKARS